MESVAPKVTVVVPTYNETRQVPAQDRRASRGVGNPEHAILVVDDNSPDGTGEVAEKLRPGGPIQVGVLHRTVKDGLGRAYVAGMTRALAEGADIVIQMDADLSHPTAAIPRMIGRWRPRTRRGARFPYVAGGAVASEWPWHRKALSAWANFYVNSDLRLQRQGRHRRIQGVARGHPAGHRRRVGAERNGYAFQVEMNYRVVQRGMRIAETPIRFEERTDGVSKMSLAVQLESARVPWKLRFVG